MGTYVMAHAKPGATGWAEQVRIAGDHADQRVEWLSGYAMRVAKGYAYNKEYHDILAAFADRAGMAAADEITVRLPSGWVFALWREG